jgi:hypothetical protein
MHPLGHRFVPIVAIGLAACDPAPQPGDVGILNVEITQGIQNVANQVPLIAGKPTFVRVFVLGNTDDGASVPTITATMSVDGGADLAPRGTTRVTPPPDGSDFRTLRDSFLFEIPAASLTPGEHDLRVELVLPAGASVSDPSNLVYDVDITVRDAVAMRVWGVRYGYTNVPLEYQQRLGLGSSTWEPRPFSAFEDQRDGAEQMLPVSSLRIDELPDTAPAMFDCDYQGDPQTGGCGGYVAGRAWGHSVIDAAFPGGGETIVVLQPEWGNGHLGAHQMSAAGNHVINIQGDAWEIGSTLAHELYHALGVLHTAVGLDFHEEAYPRDDGSLGPYVGVRSRPFIQLFPGDDADGNPTSYDLQSYRSPGWPSPWTYCRGLDTATAGAITCPQGLDGWSNPP